MAEMSKTIETILTADSSILRAEFAKAEKMSSEYERKVARGQSAARTAALDNVRALQLEATGRKSAAEAMRQEISLKAEAARLAKSTGMSEEGAIAILRRKLELEQRIAEQKKSVESAAAKQKADAEALADTLRKEVILREAIARAAAEAKLQSASRTAALDNVRALQLEATGRKAAAEAMRQEISLKAEAARLAKSAGMSEEGAIAILRRKLELEQRITEQKARAARIAPGGGTMLPLTARDLNSEWVAREKVREAAAAQRRETGKMAGAYGALRGAFVPVVAGFYSLSRAGAVVTDVFATFAEREKMTLGMKSIMGSAEAAKKRLQELRELAESPGLSVGGVVSADVRLQSSGLNAQESAKAVEQFGNALALVGGGEAELKGVALALGQISAKGKVSAEEINQIAERLPQVRLAMQRAFGTADTELLQKMGIDARTFINGISDNLGALPRATSGAADAMMKAGDAWTDFKAALGQAISVPGVPALKEATSILKNLRDAATGESADWQGWQKIWFGYGPGASTRLLAESVGWANRKEEVEKSVTAESRAQLAVKERQEEAERKILDLREMDLKNQYFLEGINEERLAAEKQIAAAAAQRLETVRQTNRELRAQMDFAAFDAQGDDKKLPALRKELARLQKEAEASQGLSERVAGRQSAALPDTAAIKAAADAARGRGDVGQEKMLLDYLQRILSLKNDIAEIERKSAAANKSSKSDLADRQAANKEAEEKAASQTGARAAFAQDMAVLALQAKGRTEAASALEKEIALRREAVGMAKEMGVTEEQALNALRRREEMIRRGEAAKGQGDRKDRARSRTDFARGNRVGFGRENAVGFSRDGLRAAAAEKVSRKDPAARDRAAAASYYEKSLEQQAQIVKIFDKLGIA
jgi:tape measure domain-containing protein